MGGNPTVADVIGETLAALGATHVFGVVGSGNFHLVNALTRAKVRYVAARHEGGAATMADAFARMTGRPALITLHQGCGLTNALTGITEAAKSRTPLVVLATETGRSAIRSNFRIDQSALARAVGAIDERVSSARTAADDMRRAYLRAEGERRTVVVNVPLDVQSEEAPGGVVATPRRAASALDDHRSTRPSLGAVDALAALLCQAQRPVFVAGRGARGARQELLTLADRCGALLATSAVARGLFAGSPWSIDVSGGFASPLAAQLISGADLIVGWGCALNMWTMRHGRLISPGAKVVQVDDDPSALGADQAVDLGVLGDVRATAADTEAALGASPVMAGYRSDDLAREIQRMSRWRDVPFDDLGRGGRIDPRTLTIGLDDILPAERVIGVDSGNFMGYPSMLLSVPDEFGLCFTQAFQSIGLGLATAIGAALARPDRLPVAALGDGGALMGISELETVVRLGLGMLIVVYNDAQYGAEVHHFGPGGYPLDSVEFPETDFASIGRGFGCDAVTVTAPSDLSAVATWVAGSRPRPMVVDAKLADIGPSWWLEEAFRGH